MERLNLCELMNVIGSAPVSLAQQRYQKSHRNFFCYSTPRLVNYLYLEQKLAEIDDPVKREEFLKALAHGSAATWGHLNLLGEYDFSEDKLKDSVGIKPPKLTD